ncbi:MAG: hypothetical protein PSX36_01265 [bacterium]|nr:hypothetical protein [bacterium]
MASQTTLIKEIRIPEGFIQLRSNGIVYVKLFENTILDVPLQLRMLACYQEITERKLTPFLFEGEGGVTVTKEARDNAVHLEDISPCKAMAVVVTTIAIAIIANFYFKFNKPKRPYKVFKNQQDAVTWLLTQV